MRIPEDHSGRVQRTYFNLYLCGRTGERRKWKRAWLLRWWTFPQFHLAAVDGFSATVGLWDLMRRRLDHAYGLWSWVCVYMCVWRDSCPAHLPPLWPATFIINPHDQVAMSPCPCQGMPRLTSELLSDIPWFMFTARAWSTTHPVHTVSPGYSMKNHTG